MKSPVSGGSTFTKTKDKWLFFDDDYVEEIPADKVVTGKSCTYILRIVIVIIMAYLDAAISCWTAELAYVLFYKRRKLTPSNIINMTI